MDMRRYRSQKRPVSQMKTIARWEKLTSPRYRYLGFTESQVKAGKLMFFREDEDWSVERLLFQFGDLPSVYLDSGYGKYAARLGLSFSSTVESLDVCRVFPVLQGLNVVLR